MLDNYTCKKLRSFLLIGISLTLIFQLYPKPADASNSQTIFKTYGQNNGGVLDTNKEISLDSVTTNNNKALIAEGGETTVYKDDAVRISGWADPGEQITITFGSQTIKATVDNDGNWFVLFSITNMVEGKYIVNAESKNSREKIQLLTLIVGKGNRILEPSSNDSKFGTKTTTTWNFNYLSLAITFIFSITLGWFLRVYFERHKRVRKLHK